MFGSLSSIKQDSIVVAGENVRDGLVCISRSLIHNEQVKIHRPPGVLEYVKIGIAGGSSRGHLAKLNATLKRLEGDWPLRVAAVRLILLTGCRPGARYAACAGARSSPTVSP